VVVLAVALASLRFAGSTPAEPFLLTVHPTQIAADGYESAEVEIASAAAPRLSIAETTAGVEIGRIRQQADGTWRAILTAGVAPGPITVHAEAGSHTFSDQASADAVLLLTPSPTDREADGMPDAVQLDSDQDREAFRRWFTFLAEAQFFQYPEARPAEINDCAALIRYAYRESLRKHDAAWVTEAKLPLALGLDSVTKYRYPYTMLGASLFRVRPGPFAPANLEDGSFAQFADAKTLQTLNAHLVTRDIRRAEPGDLLFFRHEDSGMPFHSMIYLGPSQIQKGGAGGNERYLLYHTGPDGSGPGKMRRPTVDELASHPNPGWRPLTGNPTFLGVYRWNILR
jgi:uncharacterized protein YfaT (DUF1175 family)